MEQMDEKLRDPSQALALLEELVTKVSEESLVLMPALLSLLKHDVAVVVRQSIISGRSFFEAVLEEIALQLHQSGKVGRWLEEIWTWMIRFKDALYGIVKESGPVGKKVLALKFLEFYVLVFTSEEDGYDGPLAEGKMRTFNISQFVGAHPILDQALLASEMDRYIGLLLDLLQSANSVRGSLVIVIINCLAAIARKRPHHYSRILTELLGFDPDFEMLKGGHAASIRYSLRTAFLGFLRCTFHPSISESRDKLLKALRSLNPGEATEQIIRQVDKMAKNTERNSRDVRYSKDDTMSNQISISTDLIVKKSITQTNDSSNDADESRPKRTRFNLAASSPQPAQLPNVFSKENDDLVNELSSKTSLPASNLAPVEQMIAMIGALLAEGERGADSLELLISQIQPDLMADIVIANMKHLPRNPLPLFSKLRNWPVTSQASSSTTASLAGPSPPSATSTIQSLDVTSQLASTSITNGISTSPSDASPFSNPLPDVKRDPRRDPRRLDPRRAAGSGGAHSMPLNLENINDMHSGLDDPLSRSTSTPIPMKVEIAAAHLVSKSEREISESPVSPFTDPLTSQESSMVPDEDMDMVPATEVYTSSDMALSPVRAVDQDLGVSTQSEVTPNEGVSTDILESDQYAVVSSAAVLEEKFRDLPLLPPYVELTDEQKRILNKSVVTRITGSYEQLRTTGCIHARLSLLSRLVALTNTEDDIVEMLQNHIILDYQNKKGHELSMFVLYHLHTIMVSETDECSVAAIIYEKFLLSVAKSLLNSFPASDKSFSRLLGEVPLLPDSALRLLEDICHSPGYVHHGKDVSDGDRVTQGLGTVWSLILVRPLTREACLNIALKCAVHPQDDVRAKAVRLVANKLYPLNYVSEKIEQFAKDRLLSLVDQRVPDAELTPSAFIEQRIEIGSQETSISGSQNSDPGVFESDSTKGVQLTLHGASAVSMSQAQRYMSLFFALCTKSPRLLQLVFDIYARAPKAVKQSAHRHVPILVRTLGSSYSELLRIISDPPEGSENLLYLVLQILTEETTPSADLMATVKHLYETKLKDASILIPMLSSLSKDEVLPIFPRLVDLPIEKFQTALARILQGSAHTGPALTPAEVLVAIHDINPDKDRVALKKITDACTACFEQRTVFTQHVLAKSLNVLVEQTPLPLLFMRTVIQAIDAFPTMVDFVMELLSKLVNKQIWKMPKLWVGFLKCASQTQPHSFNVLLQLPPPQLESALNRHANLRGPLAAHANQPNIRSSLTRSTLAILGLVSEQSAAPRSFLSAALCTSDTSSSVHGATLT